MIYHHPPALRLMIHLGDDDNYEKKLIILSFCRFNEFIFSQPFNSGGWDGVRGKTVQLVKSTNN